MDQVASVIQGAAERVLPDMSHAFVAQNTGRTGTPPSLPAGAAAQTVRLAPFARGASAQALGVTSPAYGDGSPEAKDEAFAERLVAIARDGERAAFGELFEYFAPRLKSYFIRLGAPAARAEELAQEAMLSVWRKARYFDPERGSATTWIFVIARNLRIDALRRERAAMTSIDDIGEIADDNERIDDKVDTAQRGQRIRAALATLSDEQAAVIRLSFFAETPHAEISRQLGIPLGTVKSRIRLATARLRDLLGEN